MNPQNSILLVEDSPEDREATIRALRKSGVANPIHCCGTGDEALNFVFQRGKFADPSLAPRPTVVLLDLNLPGTDGRQVLSQMKMAEHLKSIPVVVLTTSTDERDITACYQMGANSYVKKSVDLPSFLTSVQRLKDFWFEAAILPTQD